MGTEFQLGKNFEKEKWKNNYFFINVTCIQHDIKYWTDSLVYN